LACVEWSGVKMVVNANSPAIRVSWASCSVSPTPQIDHNSASSARRQASRSGKRLVKRQSSLPAASCASSRAAVDDKRAGSAVRPD
jgi:hypothetical protein